MGGLGGNFPYFYTQVPDEAREISSAPQLSRRQVEAAAPREAINGRSRMSPASPHFIQLFGTARRTISPPWLAASWLGERDRPLTSSPARW
ncbi:hypothetical protein ACCO45_012888 [Purpureocillium lilacinum]|uniref:Uncharacterized protein n=1 Tax=Purpureocillium lilacinum TaxID=33203 RepID=A0ACC4D993_PURLI